MQELTLPLAEVMLEANVLPRVAESVVTLLRRNEPSKDLVSQSLSSKLTCEREMAQKALELLLTAQNAFEREREISSQGS